jgi:hypothetical protein
MKPFLKNALKATTVFLAVGALLVTSAHYGFLDASSHREAPLIANDPLADNTDVYAFRSPDDPNTITLIANYVPLALSNAGPNYHSFGENIRYEIHVENNLKSKGSDIIYRFTFKKVNEDPTTFFNIRLGKQNLKTTYTCERSMDGGKSFTTIVSNGMVPPANIGPRSIESAVGLGTTYESLVEKAITKASTGETIFCGHVDDPFFVDLGGIFDLGNIRPDNAVDALRGLNVMTISLKVPISTLQKDHKTAAQAIHILDSDFTIGVWANASRPKVRTLGGTGKEDETTENGKEHFSGPWIQVSRLGMPLTNEVITPIGDKDYWNSEIPYNEDPRFEKQLSNPELALYMDDSQFGTAVPGLAPLRIQSKSLGAFDFRNGKDGLAGLLGNEEATKGTMLSTKEVGNYLLRKGMPRSVDLLPIFHTGVPNHAPYQLATGKMGNPLAKGKPFINNFLPTFGDMLRLNMAVPPTPRNSPDFSSLGLVQAAVLGLTDERFNKDRSLQMIPNMDGFPNGRRLEDDVTRIELQAVGGVVLAAIGLWYDDYDPKSDASPVTQDLIDVLSFTTGVEANDVSFKSTFPYQANPPSGFELRGGIGAGEAAPRNPMDMQGLSNTSNMNIAAPESMMMNFPNPALNITTFKYRVAQDATITLKIYDQNGNLVATPIKNEMKKAGTYEVEVDVKQFRQGTYYVNLDSNSKTIQTLKLVVDK